jgi:hypothetical protein
MRAGTMMETAGETAPGVTGAAPPEVVLAVVVGRAASEVLVGVELDIGTMEK